MYFNTIVISLFTILITGCNTTGNPTQNIAASKIVKQVDQANVERPDFNILKASFEKESSSSPFAGSVVELTGEVIAFALTEEGLYTVTIRDENTTVICVFNDSISDELGQGKTIHNHAIIKVQGQCYAAGLFSSNAFSLDGCRLVSN